LPPLIAKRYGWVLARHRFPPARNLRVYNSKRATGRTDAANIHYHGCISSWRPYPCRCNRGSFDSSDDRRDWRILPTCLLGLKTLLRSKTLTINCKPPGTEPGRYIDGHTVSQGPVPVPTRALHSEVAFMMMHALGLVFDILLMGLHSATHLNGREGVIRGPDLADEERWKVRLTTTARALAGKLQTSCTCVVGSTSACRRECISCCGGLASGSVILRGAATAIGTSTKS